MATTESTSSSRFRAFNKLLQFESKPPPLPPKDPIYLQQRSVNQPRTSTEASTPSPEAGGSDSPSNLSTFTPVSPAMEYAIRRATSPTWLQTTATTTTEASSANFSVHSGQMNMNTDVNWSTTTLALTQGNDGASGLGTWTGSTSASSSGTSTRPTATGTM